MLRQNETQQRASEYPTTAGFRGTGLPVSSLMESLHEITHGVFYEVVVMRFTFSPVLFADD
jgi:hypothetical protein